MTYTITALTDIEFIIEVNYQDEGVDLIATKNIIGSQDCAKSYVTILDRDVRTNHASLFPLPEMPEHEEELI